MPNTLTTTQKIEALLLFKNEAVSYKELSKTLEVSLDEIKESIKEISKIYENRGVVLVDDGESVTFGTHPLASELITKLEKEELSREIGRAGLETLAIVLYKGPVSRREIDHIRGVNSSYILRNLMIRGLVERLDQGTEGGGRSFSYKPTLELLRHLGVKNKEELPEYGTAFAKMEQFIKTSEEESENANQ